MKTKEEILSKHTGEEGIYLTHGTIRGSDALDAMEEYADQFRQPVVIKSVCPNCGSEEYYTENKTNVCSKCSRYF